MKDFTKKPYPETAKPFEICVKSYLFGNRKLRDISYKHIKFYKSHQSVIDALRDISSIWINDYDYPPRIHSKTGETINMVRREKFVVCTRDENGMYKEITYLFKNKLYQLEFI